MNNMRLAVKKIDKFKFTKAIVTTFIGQIALSVYANSALPQLSITLKLIILGSILFLDVLTIMLVGLFNKSSHRKLMVQEPEPILKWIRENIKDNHVSKTIREFEEKMGLFFEIYKSEAVYEIEKHWLYYMKDRQGINGFINYLYSYLLRKDLKDEESLRIKERLGEIFNEFMENVKKLKILNVNSGNKYVDFNDMKLMADIQEYEPYLGYWEKSDEWINHKMQSYVDKMRKRNPSLSFLDIGTGTGRIIEVLCEKNDSVCLLDCDENRLLEAKEKVREKIKDEDRMKCINCNFETLEYQEQRNRVGLKNLFNVIICSHVIQHNSIEAASSFYGIISTLLEPDGVLLLLFPISKSNREEFVVHGLEFDVVRLKKEIF